MHKILLMLMLIFSSLSVKGQSTVAEEVIRFDASSASVHTWFNRIERQAHITLSYNAMLIDTKKKVGVGVAGRMKVEQLLAVLLQGYDYKLITLPDRKLLIQVGDKNDIPIKTEALPLALEDRVLHIDNKPATVGKWFQLIAEQTQVKITYAFLSLNLSREVKFERSGEITIGQLLKVLLKDYDYQLHHRKENELYISVIRSLAVNITGVVAEEVTNEKLHAAQIYLTDASGMVRFVQTDANGVFNINVGRGKCKLVASYLGYASCEKHFSVDADTMLSIKLASIPYEIKNVKVQRRKSNEEMSDVAPSNMISFTNSDLFSQIRSLPGVSIATANSGMNVFGGGTDENITLLEGFPMHNVNHLNSMLPLFNGDAIKSVSFYNSFIPTQYEGRLSSVTDVRLRDGNKQQFANTLSLEMPSASAVLEGPIVKNKLSYLVAGRHSWLNFFDSFLTSKEKMNHTFSDLNLKLAWDIDSVTSLKFTVYNSTNDYKFPEQSSSSPMLHWNNQMYALHFNTILSPKFSNTTSLAFCVNDNSANAKEFGLDTIPKLKSGIDAYFLNTEFTYHPGGFYTMRWGMKASLEKYKLATFGLGTGALKEEVKQLSLFYDTRLRLTDWLYAQMGLNYVLYLPKSSRKYGSLQPRISLKSSLGNNDLLFVSVSRMEQFHHHVPLADITASFDFFMPSINNFKPCKSIHYEAGWRHYFPQGTVELSAYYRRRSNILTLSPNSNVLDSQWDKYIMSGDGEAYGLNFYMFNKWRRLTWQLSYTLSKSKEWFDKIKERGKLPSLYDMPHVINAVVTYDIGKCSAVTVGGNFHSGKILYDPFYLDLGNTLESFRTMKDPFRYRIDASYSYRTEFKGYKLLVRLGLYNVFGNPSEDEMLYYFSYKVNGKRVPFGSITFKF